MLDENRELFITETQEVVRAEAGFMLFATQNPPGQYGGRKVAGCNEILVEMWCCMVFLYFCVVL